MNYGVGWSIRRLKSGPVRNVQHPVGLGSERPLDAVRHAT